MDTIFESRALVKRYKGFTALESVSIALHKGKIYGLVGNNGAGKTTLMRLICGLTKPSSGYLSLFGASDRKGLSRARKMVGALIENPIAYPELSVRQNLRALSLATEGSDAKDVERVLGITGAQSYGKTAFRSCSTGMRQRYGVAAALLGNPRFLVLDEPFSGVDVEGMDDLSDLFRELADDGTTILISSHQLSRLESVATDYIFLDHGKVMRTMSAAELRVEISESHTNIEDYFKTVILGRSGSSRA